MRASRRVKLRPPTTLPPPPPPSLSPDLEGDVGERSPGLRPDQSLKQDMTRCGACLRRHNALSEGGAKETPRVPAPPLSPSSLDGIHTSRGAKYVHRVSRQPLRLRDLKWQLLHLVPLTAGWIRLGFLHLKDTQRKWFLPQQWVCIFKAMKGRGHLRSYTVQKLPHDIAQHHGFDCHFSY